ncbi:MAG: hypothetical protein ACRYF5_18815 [Janthinobacterium lividum]
MVSVFTPVQRAMATQDAVFGTVATANAWRTKVRNDLLAQRFAARFEPGQAFPSRRRQRLGVVERNLFFSLDEHVRLAYRHACGLNVVFPWCRPDVTGVP